MYIIIAIILSLITGYGISLAFHTSRLASSHVLGNKHTIGVRYDKGIKYTDRSESRNLKDLDGYVQKHAIPLLLPYTEPDPKELCVAFDEETLEMLDLTDDSHKLDSLHPGFVIADSVMQNRPVYSDNGLTGDIEDEFEQWEKENGNDLDRPIFK